MLFEYPTRQAAVLAGFCCLLAGSFADAGDVKWNKDIKQAAQQSSQEKKPMMVMVSAPWCGYCQQMLKTTFKDQKLVEHLNTCFVPVYLDADDNEKWVEQLKVDGLPTTLIISPEMKVVKRLPGYQSADQLNGQIVKLCNHEKAAVPVKPVSLTKPLPAFDAICLVSLRDDGKLAKGDSQWRSQHKGNTVWFASADHKKRFDANPESYWPVADGACLVSEKVHQTPRPGRPVLAMIYADHVWFFADEDQQAEFTKSPKPYLAHLRETE